MKKVLQFAVVGLVAFVGGMSIPSAQTQPQGQSKAQPAKYYLVDCMKVNPGKFQQYLQIEKQWKSFHQEYVRMGKKHSWA